VAAKACVALLRGINVGGARKVAMPELRSLFEALGHSDVTTYVQSGNVVFGAAGRRSPARLAADIEQRIAGDLGLEVTVLLRTPDDLKGVVDGNPFLGRATDVSTLHVTFLADEPDADAVGALDPDHASPDRFEVVGREVYLHTPGGYGRTKLNNAFWERRFGTRATTRNWRTVGKLLDLASR
jgi:uncharacterized protein (DUF1697 family)